MSYDDSASSKRVESLKGQKVDEENEKYAYVLRGIATVLRIVKGVDDWSGTFKGAKNSNCLSFKNL